MRREIENNTSRASNPEPIPQARITFRDAVMAMETKLANFYRRMAANIPKARSKAILEFLAGEEEKHAEDFRDMSDVETPVEALNQAFQGAGQIMTFLMDDMIDPETLAKVPNTEEEILKLAIRCEKDSILFFHELLKHLNEEGAVQQVEKMISFEYQHLNQLVVLLGLHRKELKAYKRPASGRLPRMGPDGRSLVPPQASSPSQSRLSGRL